MPQSEAASRVQELLTAALKCAVSRGLGELGLRRMTMTLERYADNFRIQFGLDPPVRVKPLKVRLRPDAQPVRCTSRRYPPLHRLFLEKHTDELLAAMLVRENPRRWCSAPRIVPKKDSDELRMTVETRAVNAQTEPMPFPMPRLEVSLGYVEGSCVYFSLYWFRGYWQLPLAKES